MVDVEIIEVVVGALVVQESAHSARQQAQYCAPRPHPDESTSDTPNRRKHALRVSPILLTLQPQRKWGTL